MNITTLRKHIIDSVYNKGKLRIDTSSLSFNINNNPDAVVDYSISFKDSSRNILGYDCVLIEIVEKKLFKTFTQELIKEVNQYKIFATKKIQPSIPMIGSQFLFKNILPDYTPLYLRMFREDNMLFQIEAIKIAN
ncbi:MAG: hypothetical protein EAZ12_08840 [Sphingobacteriia bacterium]|nr:MAG: hypothetical protein EAZ12_08840 [Sphingobacteriia bacterium]